VLTVLDRKWREHLYEMDYLQEGIGLRAMAQRDPLVEYQREGFQMFQAMTEAIKEESVGYLFNLEVQVEAEQAEAAEGSVVVAKGLITPERNERLQYSAPTMDGDGGVEVHSEDEPAEAEAASGTRRPRAAQGASNGAGGSGNRASRRAAKGKRKR